MAKLIQKLKLFLGLQTGSDKMDIIENRSPDLNNVLVDEQGSLSTRPGFVRHNKTAYASSIVGLFDFPNLQNTGIQTTSGYSRYLQSYIADGYVYFTNASTSNILYVARSTLSTLNPTWRTADTYEMCFRTPIYCGADYIGVVTNDASPEAINTIRYNKTDMSVNALTQRATPDNIFAPSCIFGMTGVTTVYIAYMHKEEVDQQAHLIISSMAANHAGYAGVLDENLGATTGVWSYLNAYSYAANLIHFSFFTDSNKLTIGNYNTNTSTYSVTSYSGAAYASINQTCFAYINPGFSGFYLTTADAVSHDLYFCSCDADGANLALGATLLDSDISLDMFDEGLTCAWYAAGTTLYVAYCKTNGELWLGECSSTGTGFSAEKIDIKNCHNAQVYVSGTTLYITYASYDGSGYKINLYTKDL